MTHSRSARAINLSGGNEDSYATVRTSNSAKGVFIPISAHYIMLPFPDITVQCTKFSVVLS